MALTPIILWLRDDRRVEDHPALAAACATGAPVLPVFIWSPEDDGRWVPGAAARWWLHHSLAGLGVRLAARSSRLLLRRGPAAAALLALGAETGAREVVASRRYGPQARIDDAVSAALASGGMRLQRFGALLYEPESVSTRQGGVYQVFTPFWRQCQQLGEPRAPVPVPERLRAPASWPASVALDALALRPAVRWDGGLARTWTPGESGARAALARFVQEADAVAAYPEARDVPGIVGTSRLSPHLHAGELSPHQVWQAVRGVARGAHGRTSAAGAEAYLRQLVWREFAQHLLQQHPHTATDPLQTAYAKFPWRRAPAEREAWQRGRTGYPIVDAGMRELWETGWMHNRVRMIVASFLVKDLLLSWQEGAAWFWDTLVDADLANNTLGWQWAAGCGADAAPFFRIFNPVLQGEKFDADGAYVRRFVPELARVPARWIHQPWAMPAAVSGEAGVELGRTYPEPIVSHTMARIRAREALKRSRT